MEGGWRVEDLPMYTSYQPYPDIQCEPTVISIQWCDIHVHVHCTLYNHVNLDTGCVGHAIKDLKPTTPDLKAGHPVCYSSIVCVCVCVCLFDGGFLGFFLLLSIVLLVRYTHS